MAGKRRDPGQAALTCAGMVEARRMEPWSSRLLEKGTFGPIIGSVRKVTDAGVN
jgi:hypothetical protein